MCDIPDKPGDSEEYSREMHYGQEDTEEHADQVHSLIQQLLKSCDVILLSSLM